MAMTVQYMNFGGMMIGEIRNGVVTDYLPDTLDSCIGTVDSNGNVTSTTEYYPFGEVAASTGTNPSPWGFAGLLGYYTDAATRLYVRARYLKPDLARWITVDPLWPAAPAYSYAENMPNRFADRLGMQTDRSPGVGGKTEHPISGGNAPSGAKCAVKVCSQYDLELYGWRFFNHQYICAIRADGSECKAGLNIDGTTGLTGPCSNEETPGRHFHCVTWYTDCESVERACNCMAAHKHENYWLTGTCRGYVNLILDCINPPQPPPPFQGCGVPQSGCFYTPNCSPICE